MKRSKMIREILKVLKNWEGSRLEYKTAKEVLDKIEELGMLPPERYREHDWYKRGITYAQWLQQPSMVNKWESER